MTTRSRRPVPRATGGSALRAHSALGRCKCTELKRFGRSGAGFDSRRLRHFPFCFQWLRGCRFCLHSTRTPVREWQGGIRLRGSLRVLGYRTLANPIPDSSRTIPGFRETRSGGLDPRREHTVITIGSPATSPSRVRERAAKRILLSGARRTGLRGASRRTRTWLRGSRSGFRRRHFFRVACCSRTPTRRTTGRHGPRPVFARTGRTHVIRRLEDISRHTPV
jgi:hypothetical protein